MSDDPKFVVLDAITRLDIPRDRVLKSALEADLTSAIVIGETREGELYFASSLGDDTTVNWLLDKAKQELLSDD